MVTVCEDFDHIFDALAAGATGYLLKQTRRELLARIKEVHDGGSAMTGNIARHVVQAFHREDPETPDLEKLSQRERDVLELLARSSLSIYLYTKIMQRLDFSRETVNTYIRRIYENAARSILHAGSNKIQPLFVCRRSRVFSSRGPKTVG